MKAVLKYDELLGFTCSLGALVLMEDMNLRKSAFIELIKKYAEYKGIKITGLEDESVLSPYVANAKRRVKINKYNSKKGLPEQKNPLRNRKEKEVVKYRPADLEIARFRANELRIVEFCRARDIRARRGVIEYAYWCGSKKKIMYVIKSRDDMGKPMVSRLPVDHLSIKFLE